LYIVSLVSIFFGSQIYSILQLESKLRKAKSANKITIDRKEVKEARGIEARTTKKSTEVDAGADATIAAVAATTTTNKKRLLELREQFVCTHVSLVFKIALMLLSCLLLFNNS